MSTTVTVKWNDDVIQKTKNAISDMKLIAAKAIIKKASELVPVKTGYLKSRLGYESDGSAVFADADYAIYPEYGTSKMAAQPYMRPAIDKRIIINTIKSNFNEKVK